MKEVMYGILAGVWFIVKMLAFSLALILMSALGEWIIGSLFR